jgi:hypothetical protein
MQATTEELPFLCSGKVGAPLVLLSYNDGNGVFCGSAPSLYNEDLRQLESELRVSLESAVEDDGKKGFGL